MVFGHALGARQQMKSLLEEGASFTTELRDRYNALSIRILGSFLFGPLAGLYMYRSNADLGPAFGVEGGVLFGIAYVMGRRRGKKDVLSGSGRSHSPLKASDQSSEQPASSDYRASPTRYTLDKRGLQVFQSAVYAYNRAMSRLPERNAVDASELAAIINDPDLTEAEQLFQQAITIETTNAGDLLSWEQIAYLSNAVRAHLWLALVYAYRHEAERCAAQAQLAETEYNRLPQEVQQRDEGLGMKADILFRFVEADEMRAVGTTDELIARYEQILQIDKQLGDREQAAEVRGRIEALKRRRGMHG